MTLTDIKEVTGNLEDRLTNSYIYMLRKMLTLFSNDFIRDVLIIQQASRNIFLSLVTKSSMLHAAEK
jgi:hypothetical protein